MPRQLELTWDKASKRWKKKYRGKQFYFPFGASKSDRPGYQRAVEEWRATKAKIDAKGDADKPHRAQYETAIKLRQELSQFCLMELQNPPVSVDRVTKLFRRADVPTAATAATPSLAPVRHDEAELPDLFAITDAVERADLELYLGQVRETYRRAQAEIVKLRSLFQRVRPPALDQPDTLSVFPFVPFPDWIERLAAFQDFQRWTGNTPRAESVSANLDQFLRHKEQEARAGKISPAWYASLAARLEQFRTHAGTLAVQNLTAQTLRGFHAAIVARIEEETISQHYARNVLKSVKAFVQWLWEEGILTELPRNLRRLQVHVDEREIETFTPDELRRLLDGAPDRTRLYLLLMMNCGMYQTDIADLSPNEVDRERGIITRKRSKTANHENVPKVAYPLWDETYRLLIEFGRAEGPHVLLNRNGTPLVQRRFQANGKVSGIDNIDKAYERLCSRLGVATKPLMLIRKTSATTLETHETFGRFAQYFLGQAPQSLTERRYAKPSPEQFTRAVSWLGDQFAFPTDPARVG